MGLPGNTLLQKNADRFEPGSSGPKPDRMVQATQQPRTSIIVFIVAF